MAIGVSVIRPSGVFSLEDQYQLKRQNNWPPTFTVSVEALVVAGGGGGG